MTYEQYLNEHGIDAQDAGSLPETVGRCVFCEDKIHRDDTRFIDDNGNLIHRECFKDYITYKYDTEELAELLGYEEVIV